MKGIRADVFLCDMGLAKSREKARSFIMAGMVYRGEQRVDKPGDLIKEGEILTVKEDPVPYVSRGGLKLKKALDTLGISVLGKVAADLGASSGGFSDCMLQNGAIKVYAIDVGYGQLDWSLRNDSRVVVMERTNARNMALEWFETPIEFATMDLSFISVRLILVPLYNVMCNDGEVVVLVKPQFEAGRENVGKNGVVRSVQTHMEVLSNTALFAQQLGFEIVGMDFSPITGPKGNIEFLLALRKRVNNGEQLQSEAVVDMAKEVVKCAHSKLAL